MTKPCESTAAGLAFSGVRELDIVAIANLAASGFEVLGHRIGGVHVLSDTRARVVCARFALRISIREDVRLATLPEPAALYLQVEIAPRPGAPADRHSRDSVLARMVQILHDRLAPDYVKWIGSDVAIPSADFARAAGRLPAQPRRTSGERHKSRKRLPDVEETNRQLLRRIAAHDPLIMRNVSTPGRARKFLDAARLQDRGGRDAARARIALAREREEEDIERTAPRRLSAWLISFAVAMFAMPVGIALLILNLWKGENLRLASQSAAVTGTFIGLQAVGSTAQAMATLKTMLG